MNRPTNYTVAAILQLIVSVLALVLGFRDLQPGSAAMDAIPLPVLVLALVAGALGLVSVYGIWLNQRWGVILAIVVRAADGLAAAPGMLFAPTPEMKTLATLGVAVSIAVIALLLWPKPRPLAA